MPGQNLGRAVPVKELRTYGQEIPLLDFLVEGPIDAIVVGPNHVVPVKVPSPERFVLHKLLSSQSRKTDRDKIRKDLAQAAILAAAVEEDTPGSLEETYAKIPKRVRESIKRGAKAAANLFEDQTASVVLRRISAR